MMCKKCEMSGICMILEPLDLAAVRKQIDLPKSWKELEAKGFHSDLIDRAYAHLAWTERTGNALWVKNARAFLSSIGKGFLGPFERKAFEPAKDDPHHDLKARGLQAILQLSVEFGDRVPSVMWNSLAHLATRKDPEQTRSILKEADSLPHHFGIVDTMLHAMGKVYTFALRVQSVFYSHTGMALVHNCDCDCSLLNLAPVSGTINFSMDQKQIREATQSLFTHMCAESHLILNARLPFEYTITTEAGLLLGTQESAEKGLFEARA